MTCYSIQNAVYIYQPPFLNRHALLMSCSVNKSSRIEYIDIAKGIAILCVMTSHLCHGHLHKLLFSFEVPLFFFLSGFFLRRTSPFSEISKKRLKQLIIPFMGLATFVTLIRVIYVILHNTASFEKIISTVLITFSGEWSDASMGPYWFLPALFISSLITSVLLRLKNGVLYALVLFSIGAWVTAHISSLLPWNVGLALASVIYVFMGAYCRENDILEKHYTNDFIYISFLIIFWLYGAMRFGVALSVPLTLDAALVACAAIIVVCKISKLLQRINYLSPALQFIGRNTLLLLTLHTLDMLFNICKYTHLYGFYGTIGRIVIPLFIVLLFQWSRKLYSHFQLFRH